MRISDWSSDVCSSDLEIRPLVGMRARPGAPGDAVAVDILVTRELGARLQLLRGHDLAAVIGARVVPRERRAPELVHGGVQVAHAAYRRLPPVGRVAP